MSGSLSAVSDFIRCLKTWPKKKKPKPLLRDQSLQKPRSEMLSS